MLLVQWESVIVLNVIKYQIENWYIRFKNDEMLA